MLNKLVIVFCIALIAFCSAKDRSMLERLNDFLPEMSEALELTENQEKSLTPIITDYMESLKDLMKDTRDASREEKEKMGEEISAMGEDMLAKVKSKLSSGQVAKLDQFFEDWKNKGAKQRVEGTVNRMKQELDLSDSQVTKITEILMAQQKEMQSLQEKIKSAKDNIFQKTRLMRKLKDISDNYNKQIVEELTDEQAGKYKQMKKNMRDKMKDRFKKQRPDGEPGPPPHAHGNNDF